VARTGTLDDTLLCSQGRTGELCTVNRDCDVRMPDGTLTTAGVCGSRPSVAGSRAQADAVLLRESLQEAIAEAAIAEAVYGTLLSNGEILSSADWGLRFAALSRIETLEQRSLTGQNPFGVPSDYVPILRNTQQDLLGCLSTCTSGGGLTCDATSNLQCLRNLVEGADLVNFFTQAKTTQENATQNAQAYVDAALNRSDQRDAMLDEFSRVLVRLFGDPDCEGVGCSCPTNPVEEALCVQFTDTQGDKLWIAEGLICDTEGLSAEVPPCSLEGVDGEFERQAVAIQLSNLVVEDKLRELADNLEQMEAVEQDYAALAGLKAGECQDLETAIQTAQEAISTAIDEREKAKKKKKGWFGKLKSWAEDSISDIQTKLGGIPVIGGALTWPFETTGFLCDMGIARAAGDPGSQVAAAAGCSILGGRSEKDKKRADLQFERDSHAIESTQQLDTLHARCRTELGDNPGDPNACNPEDPFSCGTLNIQEGQALRELTMRRREITADLAQARLGYVDALSASEQLRVQLQEAASRLAEAEEHLAIETATGFRNPANYRAVALREQLEAADKFRAAQIVTWMILRSVAYDLARPDVATPNLSPLQLASCQAAKCSLGSENEGDVCFGNADCTPGAGGAGGTCELSSDPNGIADTNGDCSLRAVFAARTVEDLEALVSSSVTQVIAADRALACNGTCSKTIKLRDLYTDPFEPAATRPNLGEILVRSQPATSPAASTLPFSISLRRGFRRCPANANGVGVTCQTTGVANLSGEQSNPGNDADDIWLARALSVEGQVTYEPNRHPGSVLCRDPLSGRLANSDPAVCQDFLGNETPGAACPLDPSAPYGVTACFLGNGTPSPDCFCERLLTTPEGEMVTRIRQVQPGIIRSRDAGLFDSNLPEDRLLRFTMRSGDLPLLSGSQVTDRIPAFDPFTVGLTLGDADYGGGSGANSEIRGVPIASSGWELRVLSPNLEDPQNLNHLEEYLRSIQDIELTFQYQGFDILGN
jgi:hypothetical protein